LIFIGLLFISAKSLSRYDFLINSRQIYAEPHKSYDNINQITASPSAKLIFIGLLFISAKSLSRYE
ncbi:MAG: hypothetical protein ACI4DO_03010, partial [Roseburia sp.]